MTLPDSDRTVAAYMIAIGQRVEAAETLVLEGASTRACEVVREITELALRAIEDNRERLGLRTIDRTAILSLVPPHAAHQVLPVIEYLVDIESAVLRYKAHRPGLRSADAAPKVLNHLLEILSAAAACK
jgi:hypothetical protein